MASSTILGMDVSTFNWLELESSIGLEMYYTTNTTHFKLALTVTDPKVQWIGYGISEMGHMKGSDIVTFDFGNDATTVSIDDRHVPFAPITVSSEGARTYDNLNPDKDVVSDWVVESVSGESTCRTSTQGNAVLVSRLLDTGDVQDRVINGDPTNIIWAWGTGVFAFHGANRGVMNNVRLIDSVPAPAALVRTAQTYDDKWTWTADSYEIPNIETTYKEFFWNITLPNNGNDEQQYVGIKLSNAHSMLHHLLVYDNNGPIIVFTGNDEMWFTECGFPIGGTDEGAWDGKAKIQIHYDNPTHKEGEIDATTKLEIFYLNTTNKLDHDCGLLTLGDIQLKMDDNATASYPLPYEMGPIPALTPFTHRQATCPSECTEMLDQPINVFAGTLHMHYYGEKIVLDHFDANGTLKATPGRSDFWDNGHQYTDPLINFQIQPGDSLQVHCGYNTAKHGTDIQFAEDTSEEMCQIFLFYWPAKKQTNFSSSGSKQALNQCGVTIHGTELKDMCGSTYPSSNQVGRNASWADPSLFASDVAGSAHSANTATCLTYVAPSLESNDSNDTNDLNNPNDTNDPKNDDNGGSVLSTGVIIAIAMGGAVGIFSL